MSGFPPPPHDDQPFPPPPPPPASAGGTTPPGIDPRSWWKKKRFIIPIAIVVIAAIGAGAGGDDDDGDGKVETASAEEREQKDEATTTTEQETTTTTERETTTTTAAPTTTTTADTPELAKQRFAGVFEETRGSLISELESNFYFESVDRVEFNAGVDRVEIAVTAGWGTQEYMLEDAYEVTKALSEAWTTDVYNQGLYVPGFFIQVDSVTKACSPDFMLRLADYRADAAAFNVEC